MARRNVLKKVRRLVKRTLVLFIPVVAVIWIFTTLLIRFEISLTLDRIRKEEQLRIRQTTEIITLELMEVTSDLSILANSSLLISHLDSPGSTQQLEELTEALIQLSRYRMKYDQIRLINKEGLEMTRIELVNGTPELTPPHLLQNKSQRYYFKETIGLAADRFYLSPFDLNIEQGKIEEPHKPVIRIGTPVFDSQNRKQGILVLNFLGSIILNQISGAVPSETGIVISLVNADGFWIKGESPDDEWGFMLHERQDACLARRHPDLWTVIREQENGQTEHSSGIYTFSTIRAVPTSTREWTLISHYPSAEMKKLSGISLMKWLPVGFLLSLIPLIAFLLSTGSRMKKEEAEAMLKLVFNSINDGICILDSHLQIITMNKQMKEWHADATIRERLLCFQDRAKSDQKDGDCHGAKALDSGHSEISLIEIKRESSTLWLELHSLPLLNKKGEPQGLVQLIRDISHKEESKRQRESLIGELQQALSDVNTLSGLLPICANCKSIRADDGYWKSIESYISSHTSTQFSHSLCPDCIRKLYPDLQEEEE